MTFHWPQITYLAIVTLGLGMELAKHGQPETGKHNFWFRLVALVALLFVLYSGGFFGGGR